MDMLDLTPAAMPVILWLRRVTDSEGALIAPDYAVHCMVAGWKVTRHQAVDILTCDDDKLHDVLVDAGIRIEA